MVRRSLIAMGVVLALAIPAQPAHAATSGTLVFTVFADNKADSGLWTMPASGGSPTHLAGTKETYRPRWAPDGSGLAYIGRHGCVRWIDADGSNDHVLVHRAAMPPHHRRLTSIAWSPDGNQLLLPLEAPRSGRVWLYRVVVATEHFSLLLKGAGSADWSSSDRIVVDRFLPRKPAKVMTMDPDGSNRSVIYDGGVGVPRWSPDGTMLVFQRLTHRSGDIFVMGADGSDPTNLTASKAYDWSPSWSPDGTQIVWSRSRTVADRGNLLVMDADGSNRIQLTSTPALDEYEPDWKA